jgi:hypothetical protein
LKLIQLAKLYHASNLRVFGSVARGENTENSDLDLLVKFEADATLLDQVGLSQSMSDLLGCSVDIISERSLHKKIANFVLKDAIRL